MRLPLRVASTLMALALAACSTVGALLGDHLSFSQPQLQQQLDRRFPRDYDKLGGLVSLSVLHPRLSLPPGDNRLRLDFDVGIGALGHASRESSGHFALTSALRYDPATRGLHLDNPTLDAVDIPSLGGSLNSTARSAINRWMADYARDEPVYQFDDSLLGRLGSRRVSSTRIENGQVLVELGN